IEPLLGFEVTIEPLRDLRDAALRWYVGLDAEATKIVDALWNGEQIGEPAMSRVVGLFHLAFHDTRLMLDRVGGEPVYLILAMSHEHLIRMKPQNLITGLPVKHLEAAT